MYSDFAGNRRFRRALHNLQTTLPLGGLRRYIASLAGLAVTCRSAYYFLGADQELA